MKNLEKHRDIWHLKFRMALIFDFLTNANKQARHNEKNFKNQWTINSKDQPNRSLLMNLPITLLFLSISFPIDLKAMEDIFEYSPSSTQMNSQYMDTWDDLPTNLSPLSPLSSLEQSFFSNEEDQKRDLSPLAQVHLQIAHKFNMEAKEAEQEGNMEEKERYSDLASFHYTQTDEHNTSAELAYKRRRTISCPFLRTSDLQNPEIMPSALPSSVNSTQTNSPQNATSAAELLWGSINNQQQVAQVTRPQYTYTYREERRQMLKNIHNTHPQKIKNMTPHAVGKMLGCDHKTARRDLEALNIPFKDFSRKRKTPN